MSRLTAVTRNAVKQGARFRATIIDVVGDLASAKLVANGTIYRGLYVIGGPVYVGQIVSVDLSGSPPVIFAPGLSLEDANSRIRALENKDNTPGPILSNNTSAATYFGWSFIVPVIVGIVGYIEVPYECKITTVRLVGDTVGDAIIDIWVDTYANFPPAVADSICGSSKPTLNNAQKYEDTTLDGWTVDLDPGYWLGINIEDFDLVSLLTLSITGTK